MQRSKNSYFARQAITAALLSAIAFTAAAQQMMRAPAAQPAPAVSPMSQMKPLPPAKAPSVMQPAAVILPPLAPLNLAIQEVNPTTSKLTWSYPAGNLQRKLTSIEWSLCTGPGDNCQLKTKAGPPQVNINDQNLGAFLGFPFEKVSNGSAIVGVKMCYINGLGSGCARIDVAKPVAMGAKQSILKMPSKPVPSATGVAALNSGAINTAVLAEPMTVNFGSVFSGDSQHKIVRVVSPRDGKVTISLAPNSPFIISDVKVYGVAETRLSGAASTLPQKKVPASQQLKSAGPSSAPMQTFNFSRSLLSTSATAPFTVAVKEGNELVVSLVFAPKLDLFNGPAVGDHKAALAIDGGMWKTSVPVSGRFEGLKIGLVAVMSNRDMNIFTGTTGALTDAELVLTNTDKQPVTVQIKPKQLPSGFAMTELSIQIPAGATTKATLPVTVSSAMHEGAQQAAELTAHYAGTTKTVPFTFSVYPSTKQIKYSGEDGLEWAFWMTISNTGHTYYAYQVKNPNYLVNRRFMFEVRWKGMRLNTMGNDVGNHFPGKKGDFVPYAWSTQNNLVRDHYVEMLQDTPTVSMTYENY